MHLPCANKYLSGHRTTGSRNKVGYVEDYYKIKVLETSMNFATTQTVYYKIVCNTAAKNSSSGTILNKQSQSVFTDNLKISSSKRWKLLKETKTHSQAVLQPAYELTGKPKHKRN